MFESSTEKEKNIDNQVMWQFQLKTNDGKYMEEISEPLPTSSIVEMQKKDQFKNGAQVRRVGTDTFYDIKRIDFDLYV